MVRPVAGPRVPLSSKKLPLLRIEACDPRSDNRRRMVEIGSEAVVIRRAVAGIPMAIRVPLSAYRGVTLRIAGLEGGRFHYQVRLLHRDSDLSVPLAEGENEAAVEAQWREWVRSFGLPAFVGRTASDDIQVNIEGVDLTRRAPHGRRRVIKRPRFLRRRKVGQPIPAAAAACPEPPTE
ncbi:MAG TPA: DUF6101 family protein [Roseiarcus sp.]|nr:DUF6101 family protein [Roseiarcus sp.]